MSRSTIVAHGRLHTINGLEPRLRGSIVQAVVVAQLRDDLTGGPVEGVRVRSKVAGLRGRTASSGFVGLVGDPSRALPGLAGTSYDVDLELEAPGYAPRREVVPFPAQVGFPASFEPADLGVLVLRRLPVEVRVGSYELDAANRLRPLAAATVRLERFWRHLADLGSTAATDDLLALTPGLRAPRAIGASVDVPVLSQPAESPRALVAGAGPGITRIAVTRGGVLAAGDLVGLDLADPERAERIEVMAVHGPADPESPAELVLRFPLAHGHPAGAPADRVLAPPAAPTASLVAEALVGDRTVAVSSAAGLAAGTVVRLSGGAAAPEYCTIGRYELTTDSEGAGRFPPMTGVAAVAVSAALGGLGATARVTLTRPSPAVDLTLT